MNYREMDYDLESQYEDRYGSPEPEDDNGPDEYEESPCDMCGDYFTDDDPPCDWYNTETGVTQTAHGEGEGFGPEWRLA